MDWKVNGQFQTEWGWLVAVYLFLGGVGAGAYTIGAVNGFVGEGVALATTVGLWIGFPALAIGSLFLIADLGSPARAFLAGKKPVSSWIARGTWIITLFMLVAFTHFVLHMFTEVRGTPITVLSVVGIVLAVMTMAYTGILLGASKGIPFWRSGVVPVVFVVSALATGHFTIMIGMVLFGAGPALLPALGTMGAEAVILLLFEILAIYFFLHAAYKAPDPRESAERILKRRSFVVGYFLLGLGAPLVLMLVVWLATANNSASNVLPLVAVGSLLGLIGGLILRQAVLVCGALPTLNIAGFEFRRIARPKDPKPGIGLMPPT